MLSLLADEGLLLIDGIVVLYFLLFSNSAGLGMWESKGVERRLSSAISKSWPLWSHLCMHFLMV